MVTLVTEQVSVAGGCAPVIGMFRSAVTVAVEVAVQPLVVLVTSSV